MKGPWSKESIPGKDLLYLRISLNHLDRDLVPEPRAFTNHADDAGVMAMSTDWSKYCSPEDTCRRSRRHPARAYAVAQFTVEVVEKIPEQVVAHAPVWNDPEKHDDPNNRAHTNVLGPKGKKETTRSVEIRAKYISACRQFGWAIEPYHTLTE